LTEIYGTEFLHVRASIAIAHISYSWFCLGVCLSQPGTDRSPGEIETSGFTIW